MEKLGIFDVDFTLTKRETLMQLYLFMIKKKPSLIAHMPKSLGSALFYALKIFNAKKAKQYFISFIEGMREDEMQELVKEFYKQRLSKIFYNDAMDMMKKLKSQGYKIYLISASPEFYLKELYNIPEVDKVIGTRFKCNDGIYSRYINGENCKGEEKVSRLKASLKEEKIDVDFKASYMFSDSLSDLPLFNLVGHPYLINYKKKHDNIEILRWK